MKKVSILLILVMVMTLTLTTTALASVNFNGSMYFIFDEFTEVDGKQFYSMNGNTNIFGTGDWKQSTTDNANDNREKFQNKLVLNMSANISSNIKADVSFESLVDEFLGYSNGVGVTRIQEAMTVRDNNPVLLKDLTVTADTEDLKIIVTNNFNYDFNSRVLATQFEDNWGEMVPYGEGILVETEISDIATRGFIFQTSASEQVDPIEDNEDYKIITEANDGVSRPADKIVYGAELKKGFNNGDAGLLIVNTHDKNSDINFDGNGGENPNFDKDKDILRLALNGEYRIGHRVFLNGEFITANYGDDVTEVVNARNTPWAPSVHDEINIDGDTNVVEVGAKYIPLPDSQISLTYTNVGEDYVAAVGADHSMDSWLGDASFSFEEGIGYDKGFAVEGSYLLPVTLYPTARLEYSDYDKTLSAKGADEDTNEQETKLTLETSRGPWGAETSYRTKNKTNSGSGTVEETDIVYNNFNINGSYTVIEREKLTTKLRGDLNYYTGDDETIDQNFSTENRIKLGVGNTYVLNDKVTLTGSYDLGYATENNDVFEDANGRQHLIKLGTSYKVSNNTTFDILYKYDNYTLNRPENITTDALVNSVYKKEAEHQWYDGGESWEHNSGHWVAEYVAPGYDGYTTHEIKATFTVNF
jgi:hypothetical protein